MPWVVELQTLHARVAYTERTIADAITRKAGSFTMEESLARIVSTGALDRADAILRAVHPEELELLLRGV